jgi:hypothetical protein
MVIDMTNEAIREAVWEARMCGRMIERRERAERNVVRIKSELDDPDRWADDESGEEWEYAYRELRRQRRRVRRCRIAELRIHLFVFPDDQNVRKALENIR